MDREILGFNETAINSWKCRYNLFEIVKALYFFFYNNTL
jgi:hypothetical protein